MLRAYTRVSTLEQAQADRTSLGEQNRVIKGFALMKGINKFDYQLYSDAGVSGSIPLQNREAGARLLDDMEPGDIVCASKLDRMFRSALDALIVAEEMKHKCVELYLLDLGVDSVMGGGTAKLFFTMIAAFAELERSRIAERMQEGREGKRRAGGHTGGSAPYGYRIIGKGREAKLEKLPEEFDLAHMIKSMSMERPPKDVKAELDELGVMTRMGKPFQYTQISRIAERKDIRL